MSKEIEWSEYYGVGDIVCYCDNCRRYKRFEFDNNNPEFKVVQRSLHNLGWVSLQTNGLWRDFCCEQCRNDYIKQQ